MKSVSMVYGRSHTYTGLGLRSVMEEEPWPTCPVCSKPLPEGRQSICSDRCSNHRHKLRVRGLEPDGSWQGPTRRYVSSR